jgi:hypothetical protein
MKNEFITEGLWQEITRSAKKSKKPSRVAVAYFAEGASRLLPLAQNSRLVVDASDGAVSSGQTCPFDLDKLMKRGVSIYSVQNLHAKVYVFDRVAYVGSANASNRSATQLVEVAVRTFDPKIIKSANKFIQSLSVAEITPKAIERLKRIYKRPRVPKNRQGHQKSRSKNVRPEIPRLFIAQTEPTDWSKKEEEQFDAGLAVAKSLQKYPNKYELEGWKHTGRCIYRRGDQIIQVFQDESGRQMVSSPGYVRLVRHYPKITYVYLELRASPRRSIKTLAKTFNRNLVIKLKKTNGLVRNFEIASELLTYWPK